MVRGFMIKLKFGATEPGEETCILIKNDFTDWQAQLPCLKYLSQLKKN